MSSQHPSPNSKDGASTADLNFDSVDWPDDVTWSIAIGAPGQPVGYERTPDVVCATASIGKTLLLITVAEQIATGRLDAGQRISCKDTEQVADSGLWQHLDADDLALRDACVLVGSVSDNLATNALIDLVGLDTVQQTARALELEQTALLDLVRDDRGPQHPPALSVGTGRELHRVCCELAAPHVLSAQVADQVTAWLTLDTDLSMVAGAFGLDPLAHVLVDRGVSLWHKTGTNTGVRCDIGVATFGSRRLAWAVLANWRPAGDADPTRDAVLAAMRQIGLVVRAELEDAAR